MSFLFWMYILISLCAIGFLTFWIKHRLKIGAQKNRIERERKAGIIVDAIVEHAVRTDFNDLPAGLCRIMNRIDRRHWPDRIRPVASYWTRARRNEARVWFILHKKQQEQMDISELAA